MTSDENDTTAESDVSAALIDDGQTIICSDCFSDKVNRDD